MHLKRVGGVGARTKVADRQDGRAYSNAVRGFVDRRCLLDGRVGPHHRRQVLIMR